MRSVVFTDSAINDIREALLDGERAHGSLAKKRYSILIQTAISQLRKEAQLIGVTAWDDTRFMYHLRFSKKMAALGKITVKNPSHYLFFKINSDALEILRFLHEKSDFERHL